MVSAVTEVIVQVGGLPEKFSVVADSRRSDPVKLSYVPTKEHVFTPTEISFSIEEARAVGQALIDAAGAMNAQLRQLRDREEASK